MYCPACGAATTPGLSFCNRCGVSLKERTNSGLRVAPIIAFLIAIMAIGIGGMGIMVGGALALKRDAAMSEDIVGGFMFMTFLIVCITELLLMRQLSRLIGSNETKQPALPAPMPMSMPMPAQNELRSAPARGLAEAVPSVTENTTRTLEYSRNEPAR
ncbi:MAG TPA: zinc ribbon domain-containing protein [Pyrinomonadaceae bacterium]|nr:zinc ribbon domain-containing protein [Pyrinomonadaceae bacterium]